MKPASRAASNQPRVSPVAVIWTGCCGCCCCCCCCCCRCSRRGSAPASAAMTSSVATIVEAAAVAAIAADLRDHRPSPRSPRSPAVAAVGRTGFRVAVAPDCAGCPVRRLARFGARRRLRRRGRGWSRRSAVGAACVAAATAVVRSARGAIAASAARRGVRCVRRRRASAGSVLRRLCGRRPSRSSRYGLSLASPLGLDWTDVDHVRDEGGVDVRSCHCLGKKVNLVPGCPRFIAGPTSVSSRVSQVTLARGCARTNRSLPDTPWAR